MDGPSNETPLRARGSRGWIAHAPVFAMLVIAISPFVLALGYIVPATAVRFFNNWSHTLASKEEVPDPYREAQRPDATTIRKQFVERLTAQHELTLKLMPAAVVLIWVGLGLLLWGMSTNTTANLLAQMGARAAAPEGPERDMARTLEQLASRCGLPPPKLFFVQCTFPATFSTAIDHRNGMVAVTSGALELLDSRELDTLLAHEVTHLVNRDSRMDSILNSLAVITEYPLKKFSKNSTDQYNDNPYRSSGFRRKLAFVEMLLSPLGLYLLVVSPLMNRVIRAMVVRSSEFKADANAAMLTGNPEALAYALAKLAGAGKALGKSPTSRVPAQTALPQRIEHLMKIFDGCGFNGLQQAIEAGKRYVEERPGMGAEMPGLGSSRDHLASLNQGDVMGKVHRVVAGEAVPVFDTAESRSFVRTRLQPGALVVVFSTPGKMRQVNSAQEVFGYIAREVKLEAVPGVLPQEIYNPTSRAAVEERLARQGAPAAPVAEASSLTRQQIWIAFGFGTAVFAGMTIFLLVFVGR
jgi:Zn-dependent protease with chaperone function